MTAIAAGATANITLAAGERLVTTGTGTAELGAGPQAYQQIPLTGDTVVGPFKQSQGVYLEMSTAGTYETVGERVPATIPPGNTAVSADPLTGAIESGGADIVTIDPLRRWKKKLSVDPANAIVALDGDSTTDPGTAALSLRNALRVIYTRPGEVLYGMTDTNIIALGNNGISLLVWLGNPAYLATLVATNADLVIPSFLINDVRLGTCTLAQAIDRLEQFIALVRTNMPQADILLRMPNTFTTTNTSSLNYVQDSGGGINPAGAAQTYSTILRNAYLYFKGRYSNVDVIDTQAEVFGAICRSSHPLMADQIHPSIQSSTINGVPYGGGYIEIAKVLAKRIGSANVGYKPALPNNQYLTFDDHFIASNGGSGFIDIASQDVNNQAAAQFPITTADVLFVEGFASPISLSSASFTRPFSTTNIRVLVTGDYTAASGKRIAIGSAHPPATTGDRQQVAVDLASIAAGATATATVAVTGAATGSLHNAVAVLATPPALFVTDGLILLNCYPSAANTVTLVVLNPTGGAVDTASAVWSFWVVR